LEGLDFLSGYYSTDLHGFFMTSKMQKLLTEALKHSHAGKIEALTELAHELHQVDQIISRYHGEKEALIQILLDINAKYHWLPKTSLLWVSERLDVPLAQIYHIGSFYKVFSLVPQGRHIIQVCLGTACEVRNAPRLLDLVGRSLKLLPDAEAEKEKRFTLTTVNCLGCCALGPVMVIDEDHYSNPSQEQMQNILANYK
jgi:NADH-quinone oxidoreductase subunit E